jgi:hypothetical protein
MTRFQTAKDPDGLGSLLPAISSVLFGVLAGYVLRRAPDQRSRLRSLLTWRRLVVRAGSVHLDPNQQAALDSVICSAAWPGLASACMAFWIWVADHAAMDAAVQAARDLGMNAIAAYIVSHGGRNAPQVHVSGMNLYDVRSARCEPGQRVARLRRYVAARRVSPSHGSCTERVGSCVSRI